MTLKSCYYILLAVVLLLEGSIASLFSSESSSNESHKQLETAQTEFKGLMPDGFGTTTRNIVQLPNVHPAVFTNRIGGTKPIDVSWLLPEREDLESGILRVSNDTDFEEARERFQIYFKNSLDELARSVTPHLLRTFYNLEISPACMSSALYFLDGFRNLKGWALRMWDSNGFYPGSLLGGNLISVGNYDMCINTKATMDSAGDLFVGQYCSLYIRSSFPSDSYLHPSWDIVVHPEEIEHVMEIPSRKLQKILDLVIYHTAVCIPSTCTKQDVQTMFDAVSRYTSILNITIQKCEVKQDLTEVLDAQLIAWMCLLGFTVGFGLICTLVDVVDSSRTKEKSSFLATSDEVKNSKCKTVVFLAICRSFSLVRNAKKLTSKESPDNKLNFLHGFRVFTVAWIVLAHSYVVDPRLLGGAVTEYAKLGSSVWFQLISNGAFAVDTFLFMSGFLVAHLCLEKIHQQKGRFSYIAFYANRIWRITPPYLFVIGIYIILTSFGSGPMWHETLEIYVLGRCKETWWKNLLFINNFFFIVNSCSGHFWYLGLAIQFVLISPPIVLMLYKKPSFGLSILFFLTLLCMTLQGVLTFLWNMPPSLLFRIFDLEEFMKYLMYMYQLPYNHGGPYFLGMALGYFLYRKGEIKVLYGNGEMKVNLMVKCLGWIASTAICLSAIYSIYPWNRGDYVPQEWAAVYAAFSRTAWGLGIAWIFFVCFTGNGGFVNSFLSSKLLIPFSRLSYCVYLIHYVFIALFRAHSKGVQYFSHLNVVYLFSAVMFLSHLSAIFCTLFFESPFIALEKLMQSRFCQSAKLKASTDIGKEEPVKMC